MGNRLSFGECCPDDEVCQCVAVRCGKVTCPDGTSPPFPKCRCCPSEEDCFKKPDCSAVTCLREDCPDGSPAPTPSWSCCPDRNLCQRKVDCSEVRCLIVHYCKDGSIAPFPEGQCCNDAKLCKPAKYNEPRWKGRQTYIVETN